jgi:DNA-binding transcriptional ArsR family regulator
MMKVDELTANYTAELFRTLGDPTRVKLIALLLEQEFPVHTLSKETGASQSAISHQLRILRQMRVVRVRKAGRQVFYCLDDEHVAELLKKGLEHARHG